MTNDNITYFNHHDLPWEALGIYIWGLIQCRNESNHTLVE